MAARKARSKNKQTNVAEPALKKRRRRVRTRTLFGQAVVGRTFRGSGIVFMVMGIKPYPSDEVSPQYQQILAMPPGKLVAVSYRGTLIPNITVHGGVVRLTRIAVAGSILSTPKAISQALGIRKANCSYALRQQS